MTEQPQAGRDDRKVQLGCGTLILIALIVIIFSSGNEVEDLEDKIDELQMEVVELRHAVEALAEAQKEPPPATTTAETEDAPETSQ